MPADSTPLPKRDEVPRVSKKLARDVRTAVENLHARRFWGGDAFEHRVSLALEDLLLAELEAERGRR